MTTRAEWHNQVIEPALDPELPIVDAHHHLWVASPSPRFEPYVASTMAADIAESGHNVVATVYTDSHANYRSEGPEEFRYVGETEFVDRVAEETAARGGKKTIIGAAIVSHANLLMGKSVGDVLDAHMAASPRFRGIRFMTAFDADLPPIYGATEPGIMKRPEFRDGFAELANRGLSFDAWMFQSQLPELVELAAFYPDANIILNHVGGPIEVGRFAGRRDNAFAEWKRNMAAVAEFPKVSVKLGALNMGQTGMDATDQPRPHTSEQTARLQRDHILTTIDLFGPERCMFESNFPVDALSTSYGLLWNAFKRITADLSASDRTLLFSKTAARVYKIEGVPGL